MTKREDADASSVAGDTALIEIVTAHYAPPGLAPSARFALEEGLWSRIEKKRLPGSFRTVLAMVTVVATVLWFVRSPDDTDTLSMAAAVIDAWEYDVLYSDAPDGESFVEASVAALPDGYESVEVLLEGDALDEENGEL